MIRLTDEGIERLDYSYDGRPKTSREVDRHVKVVVAKAQLKKVVEWIDDIGEQHTLGLLKEALLEEVK